MNFNCKAVLENKEHQLKREMVKEVMDYTKDINNLISSSHRHNKIKTYRSFMEGLSYAFDELTNDEIDDTIHYFKLSLLITYKELFNQVQKMEYQTVISE